MRQRDIPTGEAKLHPGSCDANDPSRNMRESSGIDLRSAGLLVCEDLLVRWILREWGGIDLYSTGI